MILLAIRILFKIKEIFITRVDSKKEEEPEEDQIVCCATHRPIGFFSRSWGYLTSLNKDI